MSERTFTAGEAATVTGISPNTAADWRRRGLLAAGDGKWSRLTLRDLARLRMTRALIEAGLPVSVALEHAPAFQDPLASSVIASGKEGYDPMLAVIAKRHDLYSRDVVLDISDLVDYQSQRPDGKSVFNFSSIIIINLADIGSEMADNLASLATSQSGNK